MRRSNLRFGDGAEATAGRLRARYSRARASFLPAALVVASLVLASPLRAQDPAQETIAVKAGKIIPVSGPAIDNGIVLVRGGKIVAVGKGIDIPTGARVLEAAVVFPGMVEAHTARGMDSPNENIPVVPFVTTADGFDPLHFSLEDALRDGITTIHVIQGNNTVIGGTGVVVKPVGGTIESVMVKRPSAMKLSLQSAAARNRMAQVSELRKAFDDYDLYVSQLADRRAEQKKNHQPEDEFDPRQLAMRDLVEGRLTAFIYCPRDADVVRAIELAEARKLKAALVLGPDCRKSAPLIARKKVPVVLDSQLIRWETDEDQDREIRHVAPAIFHKSGVKFALQVQPGNEAARYFWYQAATAVKYGVPRDVALRAITLTPAEIIGVEDRVGSIDVGKDANLLLLTGDPLDSTSWVDTVILEGRVAYERKNDTRLQRLLSGKEAP
jgi:imidazolonepropionase-like amidohydrolase